MTEYPEHLGLAIVVGALIAFVGCPVLAQLAPSVGLVDRPDLRRKRHGRAVPLVGGVALAIAIASTFALLMAFDGTRLLSAIGGARFAAVSVAAGTIFVTGLIDDARDLRGIDKLAAQIFAATLVVAVGVGFRSLSLGGVRFDLGDFGWVFSVGWLVLTMNAFNLVDGADGVASTAGLTAAIAFGVIAYWTGQPLTALSTFVFLGCLSGLLPWNLPEARVFLGDSGSMLIGLFLGIASFGCCPGQTNADLAIMMPPLLIPLSDATLSVLRRILTGQSVYATDRAHIHHRVLDRGVSDCGLLLMMGLVGAALSAATCLGAIWGLASLPLFMAACMVFWGYWSKGIGKSELNLLRMSWRGFRSRCRGLASQSPFEMPDGTTEHCHIQGVRDWRPVWDAVVAFCERNHVVSARLRLNLPWCHEIYFATYGRPQPCRQMVRHSVETRTTDPNGHQIAGWVEVMGAFEADAITEMLASVESLVGAISKDKGVPSEVSRPEPQPLLMP